MHSVNGNYDLSKPIDTNIGISVNIGAPLGSSEFISVDEFLSQENDNIIKTDENGNYLLELVEPGTPVNYDFQMPSVDVDNFESEPTLVRLPFADYIPASQGSLPAFNMDFTVDPNTAVMDIEINSALPAEIKDVRKVLLKADVSFRISISAGAATFHRGFAIDFPEFVTVQKRSQSPAWTVQTVNGHQQVYFNSPIKVLSSTPLLMDLTITEIDVTKAPEGQGIVGNILKIADKVHLGGSLNLNTADFSTVPSNLMVSSVISLTNISVDQVTAALNPDKVNFNVADQDISVGDGVPDFLTDKMTCLDLYNPVIRFDATNELPYDVNVAAKIKSFDKTSQLAQVDVRGIKVPANAEMMPIFVSAKGGIAPSDGEDVVVPQLPELIKTVPDRFSFTNIDIRPNEGFRTIHVNKKMSCSFTYSAYAPMAFGPEFKLVYNQPIEDLGSVFNPEEDSSMTIESIDKVAIKFTLDNTIPLGITLTAEPLDVDGELIPSDKISFTFSGGQTSLKINPGKPEQPMVNQVEVVAVCKDASILKKWDKINLRFVGEVSAETVGVQLNSSQGLQIKNATARIIGSTSMTL